MEEFEKWYKETYPKYPPGINPNNFVFHRAVCGGWKAALEWVVKMYTTGYEPLDFISDIQEELDYNAKTQERPRSGLRFSS